MTARVMAAMSDMLRRTYLGAVAAVAGTGWSSVAAEAAPGESEETPYGWGKLTPRDRVNIRRYRRYRRRQGADADTLRFEVRNLVGLAAFNTEGALSSAGLSDFAEPTNRPGRSLDRFLRFLGKEREVRA